MREELTALRAAMVHAGIDAYVIPTDDFHGSEYVGEYFKCRAYVSGFTGSAGTLVVTADWAGLWTDGRYFLQGEKQLAGSGIDLCRMGEADVPTIQNWLEAHLAAGMVLGFDGRTMAAETGLALKSAMEKRSVRIVSDQDLVGEIWKNRPALSSAPVWEMEEHFAGRSRKDKLEALQRDVQACGADAHILTSLEDICWLLNIRGGDIACCPVLQSYLLMDRDGFRLYADRGKFSEELIRALSADGVTLRPYFSIYDDVKQLPAEETLLLDPAKLNYALLQSLPKDVAQVRAKNPTELPKAKKNAAECRYERIAHRKDGVALTRFMMWLKSHAGKEPITELSATEKLEAFRAQQEGYLGPSFSPIMGYGPNGAIIHYSADEESNLPVEASGFFLSDTGGHYLEGSTDVTRTFVLGPLTQEMRHHYTLVLRGNLMLAAAKFKAGCSGASLDYIARKPLWDEGLDFNHGTGHGVGYLLSVHEGPQNIRYQSGASNRGSAPLEPGMITSDEPGIYLDGQYGIRLENLLLCVEQEKTAFGTFLGFEPLTMCPFELDAIEAEALSKEEKNLLNAYHETVYQTLRPFLTEEEIVWLRNATRSI